MKQALILTDSVGAPRGAPIRTVYSQTWVSHVSDFLVANGIRAFAYTERSLNSSLLTRKVEQQFRLYEADIVIVQVGVTDLNSRLLTDNERRYYAMAHRIPLIRNLATYYMNRNEVAYKRRNFMEVNFETAERNFRRLRAMLGDALLFVVPVVMTDTGAETKFYGDRERSDRYNSLLRLIFSDEKSYFLNEWLDQLAGVKEKYYASDHFHLNHEGHRLLSNTIIQALKHNISQLNNGG